MGVALLLSIGEARKDRQDDSTSWKQGELQSLLPLPPRTPGSAECIRACSSCSGYTQTPCSPCHHNPRSAAALSAVTPEQKTPNLPIPFLCLNLCLAQIQPLSLCLPQGKSRPLQTAAVAEQEVQRQEGAGEPDTKHGCSPACQDHHLPQEAFGDPRATIPGPPSLSLPCCQRAANSELTSLHLHWRRQRLRLPALHSSALCTLLYKKRLA